MGTPDHVDGTRQAGYERIAVKCPEVPYSTLDYEKTRRKSLSNRGSFLISRTWGHKHGSSIKSGCETTSLGPFFVGVVRSGLCGDDGGGQGRRQEGRQEEKGRRQEEEKVILILYRAQFKCSLDAPGRPVY